VKARQSDDGVAEAADTKNDNRIYLHSFAGGPATVRSEAHAAANW
jgi:hypothetical protein